jgi:hypothetical protein
MHVPTFWYDENLLFCIVEFGRQIWYLNKASVASSSKQNRLRSIWWFCQPWRLFSVSTLSHHHVLHKRSYQQCRRAPAPGHASLRAPREKPAAPKNTSDARSSIARIYARQGDVFVNLLKMTKPFAKLLERLFSPFAKKTRMSKPFAKLLKLLTTMNPKS